jgi:hypothetical protein
MGRRAVTPFVFVGYRIFVSLLQVARLLGILVIVLPKGMSKTVRWLRGLAMPSLETA